MSGTFTEGNMKVIYKQGSRSLQSASPSNHGEVQRIALFPQPIERLVNKTQKEKEPHIAAPSFGASDDFSFQLVSVQSANPNLLVGRILIGECNPVNQ
jgi:hypothetical protein